MIEEEEANSAKEVEANSTCHMNITRIFNKKVRVIVETLEEAGSFTPNEVDKCDYCGKIEHRKEECRKKRSESAYTSQQLTNYATNSKFNDHRGMLVTKQTPCWHPVQPTPLNQKKHGSSTPRPPRFSDLRIPDQPCHVETRGNITHPIQHVYNVSFGKEGQNTCVKNVLYVLTITKNLASVDQIVEERMQVCFNKDECLIKRKGRLIARERREGRTFILNLDSENNHVYQRT